MHWKKNGQISTIIRLKQLKSETVREREKKILKESYIWTLQCVLVLELQSQVKSISRKYSLQSPDFKMLCTMIFENMVNTV